MTSNITAQDAKALDIADVGGEERRAIDRPDPRHPAAAPRKPLRERLRHLLLIAVPVMMAAAGVAYYLVEEPYVTTDDAFIRAAKESINARVAGQVVAIAVRNNQRVREGQLLFRIDPEPYQIAVDDANAQLGSTRLRIAGLKATYRQQLADLKSAWDTADYDELEYARKRALVWAGWTPRELYDQADMDLRVARQHIASVAQQIAGTVIALNGNPNINVNDHPTVRAAQALLDRAQLDLSYATVVAPEDGIVTRVDDLQVGDFINPGASAFALLSSRRIWIDANFRETALTHMRPGEEATVNVDAYPDVTFKAHVVSMSPGTGSDFAVLPPENATGNWVKVVQRLPVRLEFDEIDPNLSLFSGLSVTVRVDTGCHRSWRHPFLPVCTTAAAR
jgi:membrane fusion protein, multidrug efflux system